MSQKVVRQATSVLVASTVAAMLAVVPMQAQRGRAGQPAAPPRDAKTSAPVDLTGYWVAVITEDWRWRMVTPPKGDYASVPVNNEGRRVADGWDLAKDEAAGNACRAFGVGNIMRMPGRLHITWQDADTLKLEFDAGTQTRLLRFTGTPPANAEQTWQGYSAASWETAGQQTLDRNGIPVADGAAAGGGAGRARGTPSGGALKVVTTNMREGYLRKNGVPYSASATITEYFDRVGPEPNGDVYLIVRTVVEDPKYLQLPFITSTNFKLDPNGAAKWSPSPCKIDPPAVPGK